MVHRKNSKNPMRAAGFQLYKCADIPNKVDCDCREHRSFLLELPWHPWLYHHIIAFRKSASVAFT